MNTRPGIALLNFGLPLTLCGNPFVKENAGAKARRLPWFQVLFAKGASAPTTEYDLPEPVESAVFPAEAENG